MSKNTFYSIAAALGIFVCGFVLGYFSGDTTKEIMVKTGEQISGTASAVSETMSDNDTSTPVVENGDAIAFTLDVSQIPESQRAFLRTMGITGNEIVVTNTMLACAEAEIGVARMGEIQSGATPSMSEGLKLAGCY